MKTTKQNPKAIDLAIAVLRKGGLVIFPCETVYGIAVDAFNPKAVIKLNKYKQRPLGKPYAIMCSDQKMAEDYVLLNRTAKNLYKTFFPGPITVISKGKHKVVKGIESEVGTLGIRVPDYPFMLELIKKIGHPIVATSANASYKKIPYKIDDILNNISKKQLKLVDLAIDAGELPHNEPSTVIDTTLDDPAILRQGMIKLKEENKILSRSEENTQNTAKDLWQKYEKFKGQRPIVFALEGPMGSGKTQFVKGLALAMGVKNTIVSPTYNLILSYNSSSFIKCKLTHIDVWRLKNSKDLNSLEFNKYLIDKNNVIAIEWADRVTDAIRVFNDDAVIIWVKIEYGKDINDRLISWNII